MNKEGEMSAYPTEKSDKQNPEIKIIREGLEREKAISGLEKIIDGLLETGILTERDIEKALENARNREGMGRQRGSRRDDN